ncbi:cell division protein DedD [Chimaeribacter arupi]|uniref:Cell division protein DedD n=1 Tax=Chimaeribacter arupi TaxID=2060066 RepID=A0A2N5EPY8_9GAMM|nr:cell division protein DedD [Chimaeribacter arupi]PLR38924.1 cell division protein DedD [Chimaeribacter arupi]PLR51476.1 cell division protein DedD [Chimaeribacter arupi]
MASKFQNRLVGTIILVAVGVIVLPGLLDGKKKHYEDEFAAIPLVPKAGDSQENDAVPPVTQSLPAQPPEGAGQAVGAASQPLAGQGSAPEAAEQHAPVTAPPVTVTHPEPEKVAPKPVEPKPQPVKPVEKPKPEPKPEPKPQPKPEIKPQPGEAAPAGQAYIVQLGALKNAAKVNEIVASLRLSGYRAYTVPSTPVQGQITRIFVGPDASKQKLQSALPEMNQISGLSGQVRAYSAGR